MRIGTSRSHMRDYREDQQGKPTARTYPPSNCCGVCGVAALRRCGVAALRRCGVAALRRCGVAALRRCGVAKAFGLFLKSGIMYASAQAQKGYKRPYYLAVCDRNRLL